MYLKAVILLFLFFFGRSSPDSEKKKETEKAFVPSKEWKEIKDGQKIPSGLHYRINLSTGKKEAKIIGKQEDENESSKRFTLLTENDENKNTLNHKNPETYMPKQFRTLQEIRKDFGDIQPKTDFEVLKILTKKFEDEQKKKEIDDNVMLNILRDLKYLGHQIDNGNDFIKLNGFEKIIYKKLNSTNMAIKQETLKLFSVLSQNNPKVKIHVLETGGITTLLRILNLETNESIKKSALIALSCTLRTFPHAQKKFVEIGGITIFIDLFKTTAIKLKLKIVTLLTDLIEERQKDIANFESHQFVDIEQTLYALDWCSYLNQLLQDLVLIDINDLDSIEKCLRAMNSMFGKCKDSFTHYLIFKLYDQYELLAKNSEDETDYFDYLKYLTSSLINSKARNKPSKVEL